jgi:hypothetical protein
LDNLARFPKKIVNQWQLQMYAVHGKDVQSYWSKNINPSHIENINWATVEKAMKESPLTMQWFASKHAVGMCAVGKFLKRWKESDTDA